MPQEASPEERPAQKALSPAVQKRLQTCFQHANQNMAKEAYDYATELFTQCVLGDPGNVIFAQSFIGNLRKKYNNNKKGGRSLLKLPSAKAGVKKAALQKNWDAVLRHGLGVLKINPWDVSTLKSMAVAAKETGYSDTQMVYLRSALDLNPNDTEVNRLCGYALRERCEYDQAVACWTRVAIAKPEDEEARREMAAIAVEKTIDGGYEGRKTTKDMANPKSAPSDLEKEMTGSTPEQDLRRKIERRPKAVSNYLSLVQLHVEAEQFRKAEDVLEAAYKATEDDDVLQKLEEMRLRRLRQELSKARKQAEQSGDDDDKRRANELLEEFKTRDLEFHESSCERYPNNLALKYDLGVRYHQAGRFNEAITQYQQGSGDPSKNGMCMLRLGGCFEKIKQYRLALDHYEKAVLAIVESEVDNRKEALYRAAKLAFGLKSFDVAEKHATALAGIDFGYKEVAALLDKIAKIREDG